MPGTREGGLKAHRTIVERYGMEFYKVNGTKGGSTPTAKPKGFAFDKAVARSAGRKGGRISRRTKKGV